MTSRDAFLLGMMAGFFVTALVLAYPAVVYEANKWQSQAVERGYAQYSPTTGKWGWK